MINDDRAAMLTDSTADRSDIKPVVIHVCTSCSARNAPREPRDNRPGFKLYQNISRLIDETGLASHVHVKPTDCLSLCPRPCGIAISSDESWSYLFADQDPDSGPPDILKCVSLYMSVAEGFMPRERHPVSLRASVVGRLPPIDRLSIADKQPSNTITK